MAEITQDDVIRIIRLELGPFGTNAYILICQVTGDSMIVDAPGEPGRIMGKLNVTNPKYIVLTHSHIDHIGALDELKARLKIPVAIHPLDAGGLPFSPDIKLRDGNYLDVGQLKVRILHTPGHTQGSICFLVGKYLISGDTIFPGGPGKTGTSASFKQIVDSIVTKIFILPDDTEVYPGHGMPTILSKEKKQFAIFNSRTHDPDLHGDVLWLSS